MRWLVAIAVCISALAGNAQADDQLKPDDLRQKYDETLVQLKAAQDRKAELAQENQKLTQENQKLAQENQKLTAKITDMEKQANQSNQLQLQIDSLQKELQSFTDTAYFWRLRYLAWTAFLDGFPTVKTQWGLYLDDSLPAGTAPEWHDANWPFSAMVGDAI